MWERYGLGAFKIPLPEKAGLDERIGRNKAMLARALDLGSTIAVVGSGLSQNLGFPAWTRFARGIVEETLAQLREAGVDSSHHQVARLRRLAQDLSGEDPPSKPERLMLFIGVCQQTLEAFGLGRDRLDRYFRETFGRKATYPALTKNPFDALLDLPIHRFVTTNYDVEIERALSERHHIPLERFGLEENGGPPHRGHRDPLSLTQEDDYCKQHAIFALGAESSNRHMVFHCHGRFDRTDSIIASEQDYQRWYLSDRRRDIALFRQTIELIFRSNPLLFIGYGLNDEDLLRPLRMLGATHPDDKHEKPIFALIATEQDSDYDHHEYLYQRYGVHVIPFPKPTSEDEPDAWATNLHDALVECRDDWLGLRKEWVRKPLFRKVVVPTRPPKVYRYPEVLDKQSLGDRESPILLHHIDAVEELVRDPAKRVVGLIGAGSRNKSWVAERVLDRVAARPGAFRGLFYWNAHYSDDALSGIQRFLAYVGQSARPEPAHPGSLLDQLRHALRCGRHLVIVDGCERLLHSHERARQTATYSSILQAMLRIFAESRGQSVVLFVSQYWPALWSSEQQVSIDRYELPGLSHTDLIGLADFAGIDASRLVAICSLLHGHAYGLMLVARFLDHLRRSGADASRALDSLILELGREPHGNRVTTLLGGLIDRLDRDAGRCVAPFIRSFGAFVSPVGRSTLETCFELAVATSAGKPELDLDALNSLLVRTGLMLEVRVDHSPDKLFYIVHPTVRSFLFDRYTHSHQGVLPDFGLGGLTSNKTTVWPESAKAWAAEEALYQTLLGKARACLAVGRRDEAVELARRSFSLVRSRMSAIASPNGSRYEVSFRRLMELLVLVKEASPGCWDHADRADPSVVEHPDGVLYAADLAWLYNELGLCLEGEGYADDAWQVWQLGYDVNSMIEGTATLERLGEYEIQTLLNMAKLAIDTCRLTLAEERLEQADAINAQVESADFEGQILGYRGLLAMLQADSDAAVERFGKAVERLKRVGNMRGLCYFLGHWSNQMALLGKYSEAQDLRSRAQTIASGRQFVDLSEFLALSEFGSPSEGSFGDHRRRLRDMLTNARRRGMKKHEAVAHSELSKMALRQGDLEGAKREAILAVAKTNELGLKMRQLRSLYRLAEATYCSGDRDLGIAYMNTAATLARENQFWLLNRDARSKLHGWRVNPDRDQDPVGS